MRADGEILRLLDDEFGQASERLVEHTRRRGELLFGTSHVPALAELAGGEHLGDDSQVLAGYVCLMAYFYLVDGIADGQSDSEVAGDAGLLLLGASNLLRDVTNRLAPDRASETERLTLARVDQAALALRAEAASRANPLDVHPARDRSATIGRSAPAFLGYELLCLWSGREIDADVLSVLEEFIVVVQSLDDLADWSADFDAGRWTPFLRGIFAAHGRQLTKGETTSAIVLGGAFESYSAALLRSCDHVTAKLEHKAELSSQRLRGLLAARRDTLVGKLRDLVERKLQLAPTVYQ